MSDALQSYSLDKGMYVVITGSGSALPDPKRAGASAAVVVDGTVLQFDFGRGVMENMMLSGINPMDIDYIFLTHHHFDHIASYGYYLIANWIAGRQEPVYVYGPEGIEDLTQGAYIMNKSNIEFTKFIVKNWPERLKRKPLAEPPYVVKDVDSGVILDTPKIKITAVRTPHYPDDISKSLAYRVDTPYGSVVITGDTGYSDDVIKLADHADLLIHECQKPDPGMVKGGKMTAEAFQKPSKKRPQTHHTTPTELGKIANLAQVKKVVPYHLPPYGSVPKAREMTSLYTGEAGLDIWAKYITAIHKNYEGPVVLAEDTMVFRVGGEPVDQAGEDAK
ncbi:MBL fold metallo-hydrolase [Emcibacter nanhaiensis]|nr:MBL fold metallo-hydrolase [Emcibacter nanhaiensis]